VLEGDDVYVRPDRLSERVGRSPGAWWTRGATSADSSLGAGLVEIHDLSYRRLMDAGSNRPAGTQS